MTSTALEMVVHSVGCTSHDCLPDGICLLSLVFRRCESKVQPEEIECPISVSSTSILRWEHRDQSIILQDGSKNECHSGWELRKRIVCRQKHTFTCAGALWSEDDSFGHLMQPANLCAPVYSPGLSRAGNIRRAKVWGFRWVVSGLVIHLGACRSTKVDWIRACRPPKGWPRSHYQWALDNAAKVNLLTGDNVLPMNPLPQSEYCVGLPYTWCVSIIQWLVIIRLIELHE